MIEDREALILNVIKQQGSVSGWVLLKMRIKHTSLMERKLIRKVGNWVGRDAEWVITFAGLWALHVYNSQKKKQELVG